MKKLFTLIALVTISYASMAQWLPQASGFETPSRGINYLHAVSESVAWASAYDGSGSGATINEFTTTSDGGNNWQAGSILGGTVYGIGNICGVSATTAYVSLYKGSGNQDNTCGIYKTSDGGATWAQLPSALQGSASFANNVFFWNEQEGMCHGDTRDGYFEIYYTTDGGSTWTRVPESSITNGTPISQEGGWTSVIETVGENTIMFGTNKGRIFISDDRAHTWRAVTTGITPATNGGINAISFVDANNGLAAQTVAPVQLYKTSDAGATWTAVTPNGPFLTNDMTAVPGTVASYVSTGAETGATGISYSTDGGLNWTYYEGTEETQFLALDFFNTSTGWAGAFNTDAANGGMYKFNADFAPVQNIAVQDLNIYPNPATSVINVESNNTINKVQLINLAGQVVFENTVKSDNTAIQTSQFPKGIYMLAITSDSGISTRKVSIR